jgi:prophage regulatory protein
MRYGLFVTSGTPWLRGGPVKSDKRLVRFPEVKERTGLSRGTIWRYETAGLFPRRLRIGANTIAWLEADLDAWIEGHMKKGASAKN